MRCKVTLILMFVHCANITYTYCLNELLKLLFKIILFLESAFVNKERYMMIIAFR